MNSSTLPQAAVPTTEQRLVLEGVSWQQYKMVLAALGDDFPNLRLSYLEGTLEIMTTSPEYEERKTIIRMPLENATGGLLSGNPHPISRHWFCDLSQSDEAAGTGTG